MRSTGVALTVDPVSQLTMPPGFRFYPTDEELMVNYLCPKVAKEDFPSQVIAEVDLYKYDAWDLPSKALFGETEWYFFSSRDRKYPNGSRPNRIAGSGYWKATGTDKVIKSWGKRVGIKKALVFYIGRAPRGSKTNWIMHEYRLLEPQRKPRSQKLDDWVLCRIYKKTTNAQRAIDVCIARTEGSHSSSSFSFQLNEPLQLAINDGSVTVNHLNDQPTVPNVVYSAGNTLDWATFIAGLNNTVPEHWGGSNRVQVPIQNGSQQGVMNTINNYNQADMHVPSMNTGYEIMIEQDVQSGFTNQRADNPEFLNPNAYAQGFMNLLDPDVNMSYPNQLNNSGN